MPTPAEKKIIQLARDIAEDPDLPVHHVLVGERFPVGYTLIGTPSSTEAIPLGAEQIHVAWETEQEEETRLVWIYAIQQPGFVLYSRATPEGSPRYYLARASNDPSRVEAQRQSRVSRLREQDIWRITHQTNDMPREIILNMISKVGSQLAAPAIHLAAWLLEQNDYDVAKTRYELNGLINLDGPQLLKCLEVYERISDIPVEHLHQVVAKGVRSLILTLPE